MESEEEEEESEQETPIQRVTAAKAPIALTLMPKMLSVPVKKPFLEPEEEITEIMAAAPPPEDYRRHHHDRRDYTALRRGQRGMRVDEETNSDENCDIPENDEALGSNDPYPDPSPQHEQYPDMEQEQAQAQQQQEMITKQQAEEILQTIRALNSISYPRGSSTERLSETREKSKEKKKRKDPYAKSELVKKSFGERLNCYENKKKTKQGAIALEMLTSEQSQCSFTPRVNRLVSLL